jgi:hypothetical protein
MARIFYRERVKVGEGDKQPRFAVVGVQGTDMTFFQFHLRKSELDAIAQAIGAELVMLPHGTGENAGKGIRGKPRGASKKRALRRARG